MTEQRPWCGCGDGEDEVDVLVVGYGAAGAAAALSAHDAGAQVLVVEKCPQPGGNSLVSSANTVYPQTPADAGRFSRYLFDVCEGSLRLVPLLYNTQGGPRRDSRARVLDVEGQPVPGLYAAGELGSIWVSRYQTSTNFAEALIYGKIAGHTAATHPATAVDQTGAVTA